MPSRSRSEHRTMEAAAHDPEFADQMGIPRKVAREYVNADKRDNEWKERERVKKANDLLIDPKLFKEIFGKL